MLYQDLQNLIQKSSSSRAFFLSLPVETQLLLHKNNDYIHSAQELRRYAGWYEQPQYAPFRQ